MPNWFAYNGTGDPFLPGSYFYATTNPNCSTGCNICAIYINDEGPGTPADISEVVDYIANARVALVAQPPGINPFVKMRNC